MEQRLAAGSASRLRPDQRVAFDDRASSLNPEQRAALRESAQGTSFDRVAGGGAAGLPLDQPSSDAEPCRSVWRHALPGCTRRRPRGTRRPRPVAQPHAGSEQVGWREARMKVGIIGAGMVGGASANALVLTRAADEVVLVDAQPERAVARRRTCGTPRRSRTMRSCGPAATMSSRVRTWW